MHFTVPRLLTAVTVGVLAVQLAAVSFDADADAADPFGRPAQPGVLLLRSGRLVEGGISQSNGGYIVDVKSGRMMVPFSQVRFQANSKQDAYYKLRKSLPYASPTTRLKLAAWCLTNKLYNQARNEVQDVLKTEPYNKAAKRMIRRIDDLLNPKIENSPRKSKSFYERLTAPDVTALAGLSSKISSTFVARVQPVLMNRCALAGCHGPRSKSGFQLLRVRLSSGSRRNQSERNLSAILRYVNTDRPEASLLLNKPKGNHGRRGRTIFRGTGGARQMAVLRNWVRMVTAESSQKSGTLFRRSTIRRQLPLEPIVTPELRAGFGIGAPAPSRVSRPRRRYQLTPAMREARSRLEKNRIARGIRRPQRRRKKRLRRDPFDPTEFNRQTDTPNRAPGQPKRKRSPLR